MTRLRRLSFLLAAAMIAASPALTAERSLPGATVESVVGLAKRLSPALAAAVLEADAATQRVGAADRKSVG